MGDFYMKKKNILTEPEISIIQLAASGLDNDEIGKRLYISRHTVKAHIAAILKKNGLFQQNTGCLYRNKK
jgi:DNA-binding NarL/FixJ family response regulator